MKFWKEYIDHNFSQTVIIDETLFRVEKAKQKYWKNREKHGISYNKHGIKVNAWAGISKGGKTSIQLFTENMTKELYVSIMEKHLKEMETMSWEKLWIDMR